MKHSYQQMNAKEYKNVIARSSERFRDDVAIFLMYGDFNVSL